ncbi:SDR family NAD(P)-dependent oxidoreductase [Streptomyces flaveolus]|uniref:SDR family NAD(P)-dependent oxidoreductase n=1 Tax=Streptomyces flaveolus TaxID=67297 RepID=A0ABV1VQF1_9ACTN
MSDDEWDTVLRTNLDGTADLLRAVARPMARRGAGAIVTLSSAAGVVGGAGQANYSASKAGIIALTQAVAKEFARLGVHANAVASGFIDTDMVASVSKSR